MKIIDSLLKEMDQEAATTRKMLQRIPDDRFDWKPHEKSMAIRQLATHLAELPTWVSLVLDTRELDFEASPYEPKQLANGRELLAYFEECLHQGRSRLSRATAADLEPDWTLRSGSQVFSVTTRGETIRMAFCQIVHHRAQLGVYLRLLNIPIPGSYGPSADEPGF